MQTVPPVSVLPTGRELLMREIPLPTRSVFLVVAAAGDVKMGDRETNVMAVADSQRAAMRLVEEHQNGYVQGWEITDASGGRQLATSIGLPGSRVYWIEEIEVRS